MPGATTYFGCVGKDHYAEELTKVAAKDGVNVSGAEQLGGRHAAAARQMSSLTAGGH